MSSARQSCHRSRRAAPALAVVVVRQERAAEDATQNRLEADPLQIVVPDAVAGSELHIDELLPVLPDLLQCGCRLDRSVQHVHQSGQGTRLLCQTKANNILCAFAGSQRDGIKCLMDWLGSTDFFEAPASTRFHGSYEGGLCQHSLNVGKWLNNWQKALPRSVYEGNAYACCIVP